MGLVLRLSGLVLVTIVVIAQSGCERDGTGPSHYRVANYLMDDGSRYTGMAKDCTTADGYGTSLDPDGSKWKGYFDCGRLNGQGTYTSPAGDSYAGEFSGDELICVRGTIVQGEGVRYTGTWDRRAGRGNGDIVWKDGRRYKGQWLILYGMPDQPDGEGVMDWPDGKCYTGDFRDGQPHGWGTMTYRDGKSEEGLWRCGKLVRTPQATTTPSKQ
jgi:hypothetical protein